MNEVLTLYPSRVKHSLFALLSLAFTSIPFFARKTTAMTWLCSAFFGICAAVFIAQLFPGTSYLQLTREGFVMRSLFRTHPLVPWSRVGEFSVARVSRRKMVVYDSAVDAERNPRLAKTNRFLTGASSGLPETYGLSAEALAMLLNEWRVRHHAQVSS